MYWNLFFGIQIVSQLLVKILVSKHLFADVLQKKVYLKILQELYLKREALAQVFSCEICEISKNTLFTPLDDCF